MSGVGVPIIAANMDHTVIFAMAKILSGHQLLTAISKFATIQEWQEFDKNYSEFNEYVLVSSGRKDDDIIRNRLKIESAIINAKAFLAIQGKFSSFDNYSM